MLLESTDTLLRSLAMAAIAYLTLVVVVRVSGKRTLAQLNAFDFVVTVALGSTLSSAVLDDSVSAAQAAVAFASLVGLQALVAAMSTRWNAARDVITAPPVALVVDGVLREDELLRARVAVDDIREVLRSSGVADLGEVRAVVLESNGTLSVIRSGSDREWAMEDVVGFRRDD